MPIFVRDETANLPILTINNDGTMCFGNGTPINMVTLNGFGIIDSNGHIVNGVGSSTATPASGILNCGLSTTAPYQSQVVTVTTLAGRTPNVQIDTNYPSQIWTALANPGHPSPVITQNPNPGTIVHKVAPSSGQFTVHNNNQYFNESETPNWPPPGSATVAQFLYRWL